MNIDHISYEDVPQISFKDNAYITQKAFLKDYSQYKPTLESFKQAIEHRTSFSVNRSLIVEELTNDYTARTLTPSQQKNIDALKSEHTFTLVTAHQPSLLTGPLYYIFKICSIINLSKTLQKTYPSYTFVPVFVSGAEDHDFDEIDHFHLFGKTIKWEREASGAVGRLDTAGLKNVIDETKEILGESQHTDVLFDKIYTALAKANTYNQFVFDLVNDLFESYGLLVFNMDKPSLKRAFIPMLRKEILERPSEQIVKQTQNALSSHGFKPQAHPRDINLFYLFDGQRKRLAYEDSVYKVVNSDISFSEFEILEELEAHPERFSPNVVLRPLYQEHILPNLAYIGGGGEIAYWLERKAQFEHFNIPFPILIRRNSAMFIDKGNAKQLNALELSPTSIFEHEDQIINAYIQKNTTEDISVTEELKSLEDIYNSIAKKAAIYDPTLQKVILAEKTKHSKQLEQLAGRIKRAVKNREEINLNKIKKVKHKLFPNSGLQERHDNFLQYYHKHGAVLIEYLTIELDPLNSKFSIIYL